MMKLKLTGLFIVVGLLLTACMDQTGQEPSDQNQNEQANETQSNDEEKNHKNNTDNEKKEETGEPIELPQVPLQKKDQGDAVELLQVALEKIGYTIPADGIYSEATVWAVTDFQLQMDAFSATGIYDEATASSLKEFLQLEETIEAGAALPPLAEPVTTTSGSEVLGNPFDLLAIVNKSNALPEDYVPNDLVVPEVRFPFTEDLPKKQLRAPAAKALEELFAAADQAGHQLFAQSGFRSYERQETLFTAYAQSHGEEEANQFSARPGESEHQTGLAMDITSEAVNYELTTDFGDTPEGQWVKEHAADFGFIIRYTEEKVAITEYQFEPWHLRYVGQRAAQEIVEDELTLEEYFNEETE